MTNKLIQASATVLFSLALFNCGGDDKPNVSDDEKSSERTLTKNESMSGVINPTADIDWYRINVEEPGLIAINVFNETLRYDVDVLATVYEKEANGQLVRLAADHFPENNSSSSSLTINVNATQARPLYVAVRDLNDDDASNTEHYSISYDTAAPEDNNGTFSNATQITPNGSCHTDSIGTVGDVDVMHFSLAESGVVELVAHFNAFASGTSVTPKVSLFDSQGTLIRSTAQPVNSDYRLVESLPAGDFYWLIHDQGKDNFDTASTFEMCVSRVATAEVSQNDSQENATVLSGDGFYQISGSLDYAGDEDWSQLNSGATPPSIQVLQIEFDPSEANGCNAWYLLEVVDSNDVVLFSKEYSTETGPRTAHIKVATSGQHFVRVTAVDDHICSLDGTVGMPYSATVTSINVTDDAELNGGNNTINDAIELDETANLESSALISYVGDTDWYRITVPADHAQDQVLEIFVETDNPTPVEYLITVFHMDELLDTFTTQGSGEYPLSFKTSYFIPSKVTNTNADYFVKVVDLQSDEADIDNLYSIRSNIVPVQTQAPAADAGRASNASYFSETAEKALAVDNDTSIELVVDASDHRDYGVNTTALSPSAEQLATMVTAEGDTLTVNLPWQSGYVDFYEDRDWFLLDIPRIYTNAGGTDATWYVDIKINLVVPAPGSLVEYAWGLYRDASDNRVVNEWQGDDGIIASNGDTSAAVSALDLTTPAADADPMWISHTRATVPYYLSVSDIINQSTQLADNDWAYDAPYYVSVQLVYHSGVAQP